MASAPPFPPLAILKDWMSALPFQELWVSPRSARNLEEYKHLRDTQRGRPNRRDGGVAERQEPKSKTKRTGRGGSHRSPGAGGFPGRSARLVSVPPTDRQPHLLYFRGQKSSPQSAHSFPTSSPIQLRPHLPLLLSSQKRPAFRPRLSLLHLVSRSHDPSHSMACLLSPTSFFVQRFFWLSLPSQTPERAANTRCHSLPHTAKHH